MSFSIRLAKLEDVPTIHAIEHSAPTAAHWTFGEYEARVETGGLFLAESDGKICGFLCFRDAAGEWEIENIVVATNFLRRGVADSLMRSLIRRAMANQEPRILLEVRDSNAPARRLYEKNGFREVGRRSRYYLDPTEDAVLYTLSPRSKAQ